LLRVSDLDFKEFRGHVKVPRLAWCHQHRDTFIRKVVRESLQAHIKANHLENDDYLFVKDGGMATACHSINRSGKCRQEDLQLFVGPVRRTLQSGRCARLAEHDLVTKPPSATSKWNKRQGHLQPRGL